MMTSRKIPSEAFVWIWLPGEINPVVAGKMSARGNNLIFNYGQSYLNRENAIAIFNPELPLSRGELPLLPGMMMPSCIRDASPDAWGRRTIIAKTVGYKRPNNEIQLDELTYLLESSSDRIGALDFQASATHYEPRDLINVPMEELLQAVEMIESGRSISPSLDLALNHGTSIGGARPKALIDQSLDGEGPKKFIAKFSSSTDLYSVVKAEFVAMRLANYAQLKVAPVSMLRCANKDILLLERFDRVLTKSGWLRKGMVSALTILELDELMARYASYEILAEIIRHRFEHARATLEELFGRIVFNILSGNTDDHARNHSAFWDGARLSLTPAYDICPQTRTGNEASQAMLIKDDQRISKLSLCLEAAPLFLLENKQALELIERQILAIGANWTSVCEQAELSSRDRYLMWGRQFLNPFAFEDLEAEAAVLKTLADDIRASHR